MTSMIVPGYNPYNWYWLADDGRIYASTRQIIVTEADADYLTWLETHGVATEWPRDADSLQTNAALQAVLPAGLYVDLTFYTAHANVVKNAAGITVNGQPFATDPVTIMSLNSAYIYTQTNNGATFSWKLPDGSFITLNKADVQQLQGAVAAYGQACYACEDDTLTKIEAGTITTREQVDAAFAAIQTSYTGLMADSEVNRRHGPAATKQATKQATKKK